MNLFKAAAVFDRNEQRLKERDNLKADAAAFKLAGTGFALAVEVAAFLLLAVYNASLFINSVPGWKGYLTAAIAISVESMAFYCVLSFIRTTGAHKWATGICGTLLLGFSLVHAGFSYQLSRGSLGAHGQYYIHNVAFWLMAALLILCPLALRVTHWSAKAAATHAQEQVKVSQSRAQLAAEMQIQENRLIIERARLDYYQQQIAINNEAAEKLKALAKSKQAELEALREMPEVLRKEIADQMGISIPAPASPKQTVIWQGDKQVGNGITTWPKDELGN